jgi:uncharacterized protein (TIGR00255 family)
MMSMTGFGRAVGDLGGRRLVVEIRAVNHRTLDIKVRSRILAATCEVEIIRGIRAAVGRGSIQVSIDEETSERVLPVEPGRVKGLHQLLDRLRSELGLAGPVDLATVAAFLRLDSQPAAGAALGWGEIEPLLRQALGSLQDMRAREGRALAVDMGGRAARLSHIFTELHRKAGPLAERAGRRLRERLQALLPVATLDPGRLAHEVAVLADRLDVSEELARLDGHRARLEELLSGAAAPESFGRTLEFLIQELQRELNTLGVKAQDVEVSTLVIEGKAELEKMREQAQNIE